MVEKLSLPEGLKEKIALLEKLYLILDLSGRAQKKQLVYTAWTVKGGFSQEEAQVTPIDTQREENPRSEDTLTVLRKRR